MNETGEISNSDGYVGLNDGLKPCPFCGSSDDLLRDFDHGFFYISCMKCAAEGPPRGNENDAVRDWNTRA